ncbi:MAG TPA: anion transporter [Bacteroidetes bacterium]|nr:anion transporter [Bacteroidota bacterium]
MNVSLVVLATAYVLIAVRHVGILRLQIWQIMSLGAAAVVLAGEIAPLDAVRAVNFDVMLFLFGMFVVGDALEESGYLAHLSYKYFRQAATLDSLVLMVLFGTGLLSALLMNDTLAVVGVPVMLLLARKHEMPAKPLLLALAFGVTIGSVFSPIGNPQNLLIALEGEIKNPFLLFLRWLFLPSVLNLFIAFAFLKHFYRADFHNIRLSHSQEPIRDHELALLSRISLHVIIVLIGVKIITAALGADDFLRLTHIALASCLPILLGSRRRLRILRRIDWQTLAFFAAMFILMESVWNSGFFQSVLQEARIDLSHMGVLITVSIVLSQFISNVPLVALLLPALTKSAVGPEMLLALAAGSTIAGNLSILGAASNIIIIHNAERRSKETIRFLEFLRIGVPLTAVNGFVYWVFLRFL